MSLINTMVIGLNVSLATLNQINENDQKIIARTTAPYIFTLLFNGLCYKFMQHFKRCEFISKIFNSFIDIRNTFEIAPNNLTLSASREVLLAPSGIHVNLSIVM